MATDSTISIPTASSQKSFPIHRVSKRRHQQTPFGLVKYLQLCLLGVLGVVVLVLTHSVFSTYTVSSEDITSSTFIWLRGTTSGGFATLSNQQEFDKTASSFVNDFHICQAGQWDSYVCQGPGYDQFADKLESLVHSQLSSHSKPSEWGKRSSPFPPNSTIVAVGNSHTRQVFQALLCQYASQSQIKDMESGATNMMRRGSHYHVQYENHAQLHIVTNHALFYSRDWLRYLQDLIGTPLSKVDALVVGKLNGFAEAYNTSFMEVMKEKTAQYPDADLQANPPPTIKEFSDVFDGPIVAHSMFADWGGNYLHAELLEALGQIQSTSPDRRNLRLVNGRQYIDMLGECATNQWMEVGECQDDMSAHRCIGARGGHPDLIAWDVIEALSDVWK
eukprot:Nitzschia sp. Nitz4//scaffold225_size51843//18127//19296//NITZ4_006894-RA/size51843-processed-gene-0.58-mRNA-1//1//CDS//3329542672//316//frame0